MDECPGSVVHRPEEPTGPTVGLGHQEYGGLARSHSPHGLRPIHLRVVVLSIELENLNQMRDVLFSERAYDRLHGP